MARALIREAPLGLVEDDMADLARGRDALRVAWVRLRNLCYRPLTMADIDEFSQAFRDIERALGAIEKYLRFERQQL